MKQVHSPIPDQELIRRVLSGDQSAFVALIRQYQGLVNQITYRMLPRAEDRRDIAQDVFVKVYQQLAHFRQEAKLSTWIGRITYHACLHQLRKKKLVLLDDFTYPADDEPNSFDVADDALPSDEALFQRTLEAHLQQAIDQLPAIQRTLITLFHLEEISLTELSAMVNMPLGTVKSHLFRARKNLRQSLLHQLADQSA